MDEPFVILVDRCRMELYPSFFDSATLANIRKALKYLFQQPWRNEETIARLGEHLTKKTAETKEAYRQASQKDARTAKTIYERYTKILAHFDALKTKTMKN